MSDNVLPFEPPIHADALDHRREALGALRQDVLGLSLLQLRYVVGFLMEEHELEVREAVDAAWEAFTAF